MPAIASPSARLYPLSSIDTHPRLQVRGGTDPRDVARYAKAMKKGDAFPAITLAQIGPKLYVIDGHHRLEAAYCAGVSNIMATQKRMSLDDAQREALQANHDYARRMSGKEKEAALWGYIQAGLHLDEFGFATKSLRVIAAECPVYTFQHTGKKLNQWGISAPRDDVKPFRPYDRDAEDDLSPEDIALEELSLRAVFNEHLKAARASYGHLNDDSRDVALAAIRDLVNDLSATPDAPVCLLDI
jgi:hypothetical protein